MHVTQFMAVKQLKPIIGYLTFQLLDFWKYVINQLTGPIFW